MRPAAPLEKRVTAKIVASNTVTALTTPARVFQLQLSISPSPHIDGASRCIEMSFPPLMGRSSSAAAKKKKSPTPPSRRSVLIPGIRPLGSVRCTLAEAFRFARGDHGVVTAQDALAC